MESLVIFLRITQAHFIDGVMGIDTSLYLWDLPILFHEYKVLVWKSSIRIWCWKWCFVYAVMVGQVSSNSDFILYIAGFPIITTKLLARTKYLKKWDRILCLFGNLKGLVRKNFDSWHSILVHSRESNWGGLGEACCFPGDRTGDWEKLWYERMFVILSLVAPLKILGEGMVADTSRCRFTVPR